MNVVRDFKKVEGGKNKDKKISKKHNNNETGQMIIYLTPY